MGAAPGQGPNFQNLALATDGNFYGVTAFGGANCLPMGCGTVFKVTPSGTYSVLYSFSSAATDGNEPRAAIIQGTDGNFYGTTSYGGSSNNCGLSSCGTVFKVTPSGSFTLVHSFSGADGYLTQAGLVQGTDGNFYGAATAGGTYDAGTVFRISPSGTFTSLHTFSGGDGANPIQGSIIQGTDGNLYGTTISGGAHGAGTVFEITQGGTFTSVYSFLGGAVDGSGPSNGLVQGSDGEFYGTTQAGGVDGRGTIFKISSSGALTLLHSFSPATTDGLNEGGGHLVQGADGNYYGTTAQGGANGSGTIFSITSSGVFTLLYSFLGSPTDGYFSNNGLTQYTDGSFYGVTSSGGANDFGTIFKFVPSSAGLTAPVVSVSAVTTNYGSTAPVTVTATETGGSGAVTGGVVTFSVLSPATGSFIPATCTLSSAGICTTSYVPTGTLAAGTYSNDIQASFAAVGSYSAATASNNLTITKVVLPATITLTGAPNPVFLGNPITLAATVSSTAGTPTGSVQFLDGTAPLGSFPLVGGVASLVTSTLSLGSHNITALYSGDNNFGPQTSSILVVLVEDFSFVITNPTLAIKHGGTAVYNFVVTTVGGTYMAADIGFNIVGTPDHSPVTFSPATVATGSGTTSGTITILTPDYPVGPWSSITGPRVGPRVALALTLFGVLLLPIGRRRRRNRIANLARVLLFLAALTSLTTFTGCADTWGPQHYPITVTAGTGALSHTAKATLTSQP
jgi:uncharacterized repeat protein (TIGR03803 family)